MATILSDHGLYLKVKEIRSPTGSVQKLFPLTTPLALYIHIGVVFVQSAQLLTAHQIRHVLERSVCVHLVF